MQSNVCGLILLFQRRWHILQVRWPAGNEESYRAGADGMCDVRPKDLQLPDPDLAPALQAIVEMLDTNLEVS